MVLQDGKMLHQERWSNEKDCRKFCRKERFEQINYCQGFEGSNPRRSIFIRNKKTTGQIKAWGLPEKEESVRRLVLQVCLGYRRSLRIASQSLEGSHRFCQNLEFLHHTSDSVDRKGLLAI